ncbi:MAG: TonB-dependent receptor domain-containing protein [Bryobacteraceae bacterium]
MRHWFLLAVCPAVCFGQVTAAGIAGYVYDPSGKAVAQAAVSIRQAERAVVRQTLSDESGFYRFTDLPPANYLLTASSAGFTDSVSQPVALAVDSHVRLDFHLAIAGREDSITVRARLRTVAADSAELGAVIEREAVDALPLNRRDFLQLALLTPGVLPPVQGSELATRGQFTMHANGGREDFNNYLLDGVDNNDRSVNRYVLQPAVDSVQEFKIAANAYSAEYGRNAAGQVNVITRSGTNRLHGSVYEYLRNRRLDARNFFESGEHAKYIRNQSGAGVGGPLRRDRTFFFASFDALRMRQGLTRLASVPIPAYREGDLSSLSTPVIDPFARTPFPGNRIPRSRFSPVTPKVLELFPMPNRGGVSGNYLGQPVLRDEHTQSNLRVDHRLSANGQLALRYSYGRRNLFEPFAEESSDVPGFGDFLEDRGHNAMAHHTHVFGPGTVHSLLAGFNRGPRRLLPENYAKDVNALWGVNYLPRRPVDFGYPALSVAGFSRVGDVTQLPINRTATTYQLTEGLSLVRGVHSLRAGGEVRNVRNNGILDILARGSLTFSGALTTSGMGDLLLGMPSFGLQSQPDNTQTQRSTAYSAYLQDDWKLRPDLTLNLGLRYEYNTPPTDPFDRMSAFDMASGTLVRVGAGNITRSGIRPDRNNFAPRVGLAWSPDERTAVRAGYGMYYDSGTLIVNSSLYFNPPFFAIRVFFPTAASLLTLSDPFPSRGGITPPASPNTVSPDLTTGMLQHWNLNVQREIRGAGTLSLAYAGSKGTHLVRSRDLNQPRPAAGDVQSRRPYRAFGNLLLAESGSNSSFHSLQAGFHRPLTRGFSLRALYTLSKSIDDTSAFLSTDGDKNFPQDSSNFRAERGLSNFDMRHRAAAAFVYRLPGRTRLVRGFETSAIVAAQSGQPFTPLLRFDNSNTGNTGGNFGSDRPNLLRSPSLSGGSADRWFDTGAFAVPRPYTFGSAGRNVVKAPGFASVDLSLRRRFPVAERSAILLEAQGFNLLNRTNFALPEHYADEPASFGRIFSAGAPRQVQLVLRWEF